MKGLRITLAFLIIIILSFVGMLFVQINNQPVRLEFFGYYTPEMSLGLLVLTTAMVGMLVAGILSFLELVVLYINNKSLKRRIAKLESPATSSGESLSLPSFPKKKKEETPKPTAKPKATNPPPSSPPKSDPVPPSPQAKPKEDNGEKKAAPPNAGNPKAPQAAKTAVPVSPKSTPSPEDKA